MSFETKNPAGARELLDNGDGWIYVDVRSVPEFEQGHPEGSFNVPLADMHPSGQMMPNPRFVEVMKMIFPADAKLVIGCAAGGRSARACQMLAAEGFTQLVNMHGGYSGARGPDGLVMEPGWAACGFPTGTDAGEERSYRGLCGD